MVGPLSSEEIEDVVSSVRRLVSNEQVPRRHSRDLSAQTLVLTPSFRVVSESSPLAPLLLKVLAQDVILPEGPVADPKPPERPTGFDAAPDADEADLIEADWEDELWVAPEVVSLGEVALAADEAEVLLPPAEDMAHSFAMEPELDDTAEAWAEDEPVPFVPLRRRAENLAARLAAGAVVESLRQQSEAEPEAKPEAEAVPEPRAPLHLDMQNIVQDPDAVDPEAAVSEDRSTPPDPDTVQRMPTEILDADGTPLAVLDEAALQEIVRQMIREELQGALGERITRNVRKLVRAEINRALIARDLD
jgi:hypothetical protein